MSTIYDLMQRIRLKPGMYIGCRSLSLLDSYVHGYLHATFDFNVELEPEEPPFHQFHDWVARRFGWPESTAGWCRIILGKAGGEEAAFREFFVLLDTFRGRRPTVVGYFDVLPEHRWTGAVRRFSSGVELPPPRKIEIVRYTMDAGYYLVYEYPDPFGKQEAGYFESAGAALEEVRKELGIAPEQWRLANARS